jgi:hypothetical protein
VGSRSVEHHALVYVGFDVLYQKGQFGIERGRAYTAAAGIINHCLHVQNQDNVGFRVRLHRDIVPCDHDGLI